MASLLRAFRKKVPQNSSNTGGVEAGIQQTRPPQVAQLCTRCCLCGQGIRWQTKALYCNRCNFTFCLSCRECDPLHERYIMSIQYEQYCIDSQLYQPTNVCTFCETGFRSRWECTVCKVSVCCCCIYERFRYSTYTTKHAKCLRRNKHTISVILPPDWTHSIRQTIQLPHQVCIQGNSKFYDHCSRCFSVITLESCTYQCRTCALEYGFSQRMCSMCYQEFNHRREHKISRLFYRQFTTPRTDDRQYGLLCESCPHLVTEKWDPRLEIEHTHLDLTLCMTRARVDLHRLFNFQRCARISRPLFRSVLPMLICSGCEQLLEYKSDMVLCLKTGCRTSFCTACAANGFAAAHIHGSSTTSLRLFLMAAVATLGLQYTNSIKLYTTTTQQIVTCFNCSTGESLLFFEGIFCAKCKGQGLCISCLISGSCSSPPTCRHSNSQPCYNFGLRSAQLIAHQIPTPPSVFKFASTLRPCPLSYEPLSAKLVRPIRLLYLHPGKGTEQIKITLKSDALDSCPSYEAISYAQGSVENLGWIQFSTGERFLTNESLRSALFQFRYPDRDRILWADAISISQDDEEEKDKQIENMHYVYAQATQVLIWLGEATASDAAVFKWISDEPERWKALHEHQKQTPGALDPQLLIQYDARLAIVEAMKIANALVTIPRELVKPLATLFSKPYFSRVWIVQEVVYANSAQVFCGPHSIAWSTFSSACATFGHAKGMSNYRSTVRAAPLNISHLKSRRGRKADPKVDHRDPMRRPDQTLLAALLRLWEFNATEPKDKVCAVFNLANTNISASYRKTAPEIFKDVAFSIIAESRNLDILTISDCARGTNNRLPSWAPDWSDCDKTKAAELNPRFRATRHYKHSASGESLLSHPGRPGNGNVLVLSGYLVDQLVHVGSTMPYFLNQDIIRKKDAILRCLFEWNQIAMGPASFPDIQQSIASEEAETIYCKTLSNGCYSIEVEASDQAMDEFRKWRIALLSLQAPMSPEERSTAERRFLLSGNLLFSAYAIKPWHKYTLARTNQGLLVLANGSLHNNDEIALMKGCDLPLVVRRTVNGRFQVVGPAYIHGIMEGEWWDEARCQSMEFV